MGLEVFGPGTLLARVRGSCVLGGGAVWGCFVCWAFNLASGVSVGSIVVAGSGV